jgi:hypothetical protein
MTPYQFQRDMTEDELKALVRGYTNEKLRGLYSTASEHLGTDWANRLGAEMRRRGLQDSTGEDEQR